jgi:hypothetical protein
MITSIIIHYWGWQAESPVTEDGDIPPCEFPTSSTNRWRQVDKIFHHLIDQSPEQLAALLEQVLRQ